MSVARRAWAKFLAALILILVALVFLPPSQLPAAGPGDWTSGVRQDNPPEPKPGDYVPGQVLVKFKASASSTAVDSLIRANGMNERDRVEELGARVMTVGAGQEKDAVAKLKASDVVEYAELDYLRHPHYAPDDPYYAGYQWNLPLIGMPAAWDISRGASSVIVADIDTGIDVNHPDRPTNLSTGYNYVSSNYDVYDSQGHGTGTSGMIAASTNNQVGIASMAPGVRLVMYKEVDSNGSLPDSAISAAITNAANNGAKVINMSFGGPFYSTTEQTAINYAWGKGVVLVASAGNCGVLSSECVQVNEIEYPAGFSNVLAVGATDSGDNVAYFSARNSTVKVSAPGQRVFSTIPGGYASWDGTSFSAPHVSALAALIFSANPSLTNLQTGNIIVSTAKDLGPAGRDDGYGYGRIDAYAALAAATGVTTTPTPTPTATPTRTTAATPTPALSGQDNAQALTGPYSFTVSPGQRIDYQIKFKNTGTTTWWNSDGHMLEEVETGTTASLGSPVASGGCDGLPPGWSCSWPWWLVAGNNPGTYGVHYRMYRGDAGFGDSISLTWTVGTGASPTPIATATATPTRTPIATATPTTTATPTPTGAPGGGNQISIPAGWSLISLPGPQDDPSIGAVLAQAPAITRVYTVQDGAWVDSSRSGNSWNGSLTEIVDGRSYYVFASNVTSLNLHPKVPGPSTLPPSYSLPAGWSMIGYTSTISSMPVDTYLATLQGKWTSLYRIDPVNGWESAKPGGLGFQQMETGRGYWIYLSSAGTLVP